MPRRTLLVPAAALALLIGLPNFAVRADPPAAPAPASAPGAKDALSRRDALLAEARQREADGRPAEAARLAERALALTRETRGEGHAEVGEALARAAGLFEQAGDFGRGVALREEALAWAERHAAKPAWRVAEARLNLAFARLGAGLEADGRARLARALAREQEAVRLEAARKVPAAAAAFAEALAVYRRSGPDARAAVARVLHLLGRIRRVAGDAKGEREAAAEAVRIRREVLPGDHPDLGRSLNNLGLALRDSGDTAGARDVLMEAVAVWRRGLRGDDPILALGLANLGQTLVIQEDYKNARRCLEEVLAISRKVLPQDHPDIAANLNNLGVVQDDLGDHAGALKSYEEALAIFRKGLPPDDPVIAETLYNLGNARYASQDCAGACKSHAEALAIFRRTLPQGHLNIASSLNDLGAAQLELREYAEARKSLEEALAIRRKALPESHPLTARSLANLGTVQHALKDYAGARKSLMEAAAVFRMTLPPNHPDLAHCLNNLGAVQDKLKDHTGARKSHEEALVIRRRALAQGDSAIAQSLNNLGATQINLGDYEGARKSLEEALAIYRKARPQDLPAIADGLSNLGVVQADLRDYAGARKSHAEALAIRREVLPHDHPAVAQTLDNQGWLLIVSGDRPRDAVGGLLEACDIFRKDVTRLALAQAEGEQLRAAAEFRRTLHLLLSALDPAEPNQLANSYDQVLGVKGAVTARQRAARLARDITDPDTRALLVELRRINLRLLAPADGLPDRTSPGTSADRASEARGLAARRTELERHLLDRSPAYRQYVDRARCSTDTVLRSLPPGTAMIDYIEYGRFTRSRDGSPAIEPRLAAFVLRAGRPGVTFEDLGPLKPVADLVRRWRARHGRTARPDPNTPDPGPELRRLVWDPVARHLGDAATVLVSPDGTLTALPFPALPAAKDSGRQYLLEERAVVVVPVPQMLPELLAPPPAAPGRPSLLLVGDVDFDAPPGGPAPAAFPQRAALFPDRFLPGTREEIAALRDSFEQAFPGGAARVLRGADATRAAFLEQAGQHGFLHLATHGYFAAEKEASALAGAGPRGGRLAPVGLGLRAEVAGWHPGLLSGVCFAGARRSNAGLLTALDAAELDLRGVRLVTLSACETGLGEVAGGEGVLGLQRAFQVAGARSAVTSLWKVDDAATQVLMSGFYDSLWKNKKGPLEALREAQLRMLRGGAEGVGPGEGKRTLLDRDKPERGTLASPYCWAGFVLSGDWR